MGHYDERALCDVAASRYVFLHATTTTAAGIFGVDTVNNNQFACSAAILHRK